jgi:hypothetical protein
VLGGGGVANAADFVVTNNDPSGDGSLRDAIEDANASAGPDRVLFQSGLSGQVNLGGTPLSVTGAVEIQGPGSDVITVSAGGLSRVMEVSAAAPAGLVEISDLTLSGGATTDDTGAGIDLANGDLELNRVVMSDSTAVGLSASGGAINSDVTGAEVTVSSSSLQDNSAIRGGGIHTYGADLTVTDTTVSGNEATSGFGRGGGISVQGGSATIENSTLSGNELTDPDDPTLGAGLYLGAGVAATVRNSTIADNEGNAAASQGGGIFVTTNGTTLDLNSAIVGDNTAFSGPDVVRSGGTVNATANLIEGSPVGTINGVDTGNITGQDPGLDALAPNGGLTPTHELQPASPAIDQGFGAVNRDQRGGARPVDDAGIANSAVPGANGADMGAFELQDDGDQTVTNLNDAGTGSLHSAVIAANEFTSPTEILFQNGLQGTIPLRNGQLLVQSDMEILGPGPDKVTLDAQDRHRHFLVEQGDVEIGGLKLSNGRSVGSSGGSISHVPGAGDLTVRDSELIGNDAALSSDGGAISSNGGQSIAIESSTLSGNTAGRGGAMYLGTPSTIYRSTVSGNQATGGEGGGIYAVAPLEVLDTTVADNDATGNGGGISLVLLGNGVLENTLLADNTTAASNPDLDGPFDAAFTLIEAPGSATVNETVPGSNVTGQDPQLQGLALNDGTTRTRALAPGSPAVDKGMSVNPDQRGTPRPFDFPSIADSTAAGANGADIGAFELLPSPETDPTPPGGTAPTNPVKPKKPKKCKKKPKKGKAAAAKKRCKKRKKRK